MWSIGGYNIVQSTITRPSRGCVHVLECHRSKTVFGARCADHNTSFVVAFTDLSHAMALRSSVVTNAQYDDIVCHHALVATPRRPRDSSLVVRPHTLHTLQRQCAVAGVGVLLCRDIHYEYRHHVVLHVLHLPSPVAPSQIVHQLHKCWNL